MNLVQISETGAATSNNIEKNLYFSNLFCNDNNSTQNESDFYKDYVAIVDGNGNILSKDDVDKSKIRNVVISETSTAIAAKAFSEYTSLEKVTIPDTIRDIGCFAFAFCKSLKEVNIPDSVDIIHSFAFSYCTNLESVKFAYRKRITIGPNVFGGCYSLKSVDIPADHITICGMVFYNCTSLTDVTLPKKGNFYGNRQFFGCSSLRNVNLPEHISNVTLEMFCGCSSLKEIHIPDTVTTIKENAFSGCDAMQSIDIPNSVKYIGNWALPSKKLNVIKMSNNILLSVMREQLLSKTMISLKERIGLIIVDVESAKHIKSLMMWVKLSLDHSQFSAWYLRGDVSIANEKRQLLKESFDSLSNWSELVGDDRYSMPTVITDNDLLDPFKIEWANNF